MVLRVYFFANDSRQHKYCPWRINRWFLRINKVPALEITIDIDKIVLQDLIGNDMVPKYSKLLGNLDASANL